MSPARSYDHHLQGRQGDSDGSPQSIRALSALSTSENVDESTNGAASPNIPRGSSKHIGNGNVVEQIAYDPAFRNKETRTQIRLNARTSSLKSGNRSW